jgi:cell division protease FtsH
MRLLTENRAILDHISDYLYEKETITGKEFMEIFREMRGESDSTESEASEGEASVNEKTGATDDMFED